jgi:hypothetical protein
VPPAPRSSAARDLPVFVKSYRKVLKGSVSLDESMTIQGLKDLGMLNEKDSDDYVKTLVQLCFLSTEPVRFEGEYDWGTTDLAERAAAFIPRIAFRKGAKVPPSEMLSLNRKVGGVFIVLSKLAVKIDTRKLVGGYLD